MDPEFKTHLAVTQFWGSVTFLLAETPVLLINCSDYAVAVNKGVSNLRKKYQNELTKKGISLGEFILFPQLRS